MKNKLKETYKKVIKNYPNISPLVAYTEAVFITSPTPYYIKKNFGAYVGKMQKGGMNEILNSTFGDLLKGAISKKEERLSRSLWDK